MRLILLLLGLQLAAMASAAPAALRVAASAELSPCLPLLNRAFVAREGGRVQVQYGASVSLREQIERRGGYDVLLSADRAQPEALQAGGHALSGSLTPYARARLALWSLQPGLALDEGLPLLAGPQVRRFAMPNPDRDPYGALARAALQGAGLWARVGAKRLEDEHGEHAAARVQDGSAQVALLPWPLARARVALGRGQLWALPADVQASGQQAGIALRGGGDEARARAYLAFLVSPEGVAQLQACGLEPAR